MTRFDKGNLVLRDEYLKILKAEDLNEAFRVLLDKAFAAKLLEKREKEQAILTDILSILDDYHIELLNRIINSAKNKTYAYAVEGVFEVYNAAIALLNYTKGFKPVGYFTTKSTKNIEAYLGGKKAGLNPYVEDLVKSFHEYSKLIPEKVSRIYDAIRSIIARSGNYNEYVIAGLFHDITIMRLCTIHGLKDALWRPLLINIGDFTSICKLLEADPMSALDAFRKIRPVFTIVHSMALDVSRIARGLEIIDVLVPIAPAYLSALTLHVYETSELLKDYFFALRQYLLLRLVLTTIHSKDITLKSELKTIIERWVIP
ncbi:MAG: hypothetical protein QXS24_06120 [Desulfurococcaceae archaeon]